MRKLLLGIVVVLFILGLNAAVFAGGQTEKGAASASQKYKGVTINAMLEGHPTIEAIQQLLPEFEQATGIKVNIEILPFEDMTAKNFLTISQHSDKYDIFMDNWSAALGYLAAGGLQSLDPYIKNPEVSKYFDSKDFVQSFLKEPSIDGKQYGLPVYGESTFLMYRKDVFENYGITVPKTMDDMMAAAKQVVEKSNGDMAGVTFRGQSGVHVISTWGTFLWAFGGHWLTTDGKKLDINTPEAIAGTKYEADILNKYGPAGYANFGWQENRVNFTQGKSAMTIDATVNGAYNEDPTSSAIVGKVGYAPIPVVPGVTLKGNPYSLFVHSFYMNNYSKNKEAAFLFMSWATSAAMQVKSFGLKPNSGVTSLAAMNSDSYKKQYGAFLDGLLAALKLGNPDYYPLIPQANEIALKVGVAVSQVFAGQKTAEQALKEVNDDVNSTILK